MKIRRPPVSPLPLSSSSPLPPLSPSSQVAADTFTQVRPRATNIVGRLRNRIDDLLHPAHPSPSWARRTNEAASPRSFAQTPEVQVAAYLFDIAIRVFNNDGCGHFVLAFTANPTGRRGTLDLALNNMHYRYMKVPVDGDRFAADGRVARQIQNVPANGDCFYACLADNLGPSPPSIRRVRSLVVRSLRGAEHMPLDGNTSLTLGQAFGGL